MSLSVREVSASVKPAARELPEAFVSKAARPGASCTAISCQPTRPL